MIQEIFTRYILNYLDIHNSIFQFLLQNSILFYIALSLSIFGLIHFIIQTIEGIQESYKEIAFWLDLVFAVFVVCIPFVLMILGIREVIALSYDLRISYIDRQIENNKDSL